MPPFPLLQRMHRLIVMLIGLWLFTPVFALAANDDAPTPDIRVLIDVSGSMKQSDPSNLRQPALKLLLSLLPEGSQSGVWLFDGSVTELAKPGPVTNAWINQAMKDSSQIHSNGLFTDIEKAIATATSDWTQTDPDSNRCLILLTDGVVDVSKNAMQNFQSRKRVVDEQLPQLIARNVQINTIALSDQADRDLLDALSSRSGGWHETPRHSDQLQRTFLKMFKKAVRTDNLPIKNNHFEIDRSIREFSAVLFRGNGASATQLNDPEGMDFGRESHRENVKWRHEPGYDIVTVQNPMEGTWNFIAKADPDNEIMIVTDLKMHVSRLPNELYLGRSYPVELYVTEGGELIDRQMFLDIFKIKFELTDAEGNRTKLNMQQDPERPGYFVQNVGEALGLGQYLLTIEVDGNTFQRQDKQSFDVVVAPLPGESAEPPAPEPVTSEAEPVIAPPTFLPIQEPIPEPIQAPAIEPEPPVIAPPTFEPPIFQSGIGVEPAAPPEPPAPTEPESEETADESGWHWSITAGVILLINLLLGAGGFFAFKRFKANSAKAEADLINKLNS